MWYNGNKITFFSKKLPNRWGFAPRPPSAVIRLSYTGFFKTSPKLRICTFQLYWLRPSFFAKSWLSADSQIFDDVIARDLWFRSLQSKILATPINWRLPEKLFWIPFFFENTCGCVLGPWPRAFLSLASRGSVLGKAVLGLGFFCVLGLEPSVLDSTSAIGLHLHTLQSSVFKLTSEVTRWLSATDTVLCDYIDGAYGRLHYELQ